MTTAACTSGLFAAWRKGAARQRAASPDAALPPDAAPPSVSAVRCGRLCRELHRSDDSSGLLVRWCNIILDLGLYTHHLGPTFFSQSQAVLSFIERKRKTAVSSSNCLCCDRLGSLLTTVGDIVRAERRVSQSVSLSVSESENVIYRPFSVYSHFAYSLTLCVFSLFLFFDRFSLCLFFDIVRNLIFLMHWHVLILTAPSLRLCLFSLCFLTFCLFSHCLFFNIFLLFASKPRWQFSTVFSWPDLTLPNNLMSNAAYTGQGTVMHASMTDRQYSSRNRHVPELKKKKKNPSRMIQLCITES